MKEIAIYVEGGGDTAQQKAELRIGFDELLGPQKHAARNKRLGWKLVPVRQSEQCLSGVYCGRPPDRFENLVRLVGGLRREPGRRDERQARCERPRSEDASHQSRRVGFERRHATANPPSWSKCMEARIVSDSGVLLSAYYGKGFRTKSLPKFVRNLEEEPKPEVS